MFKKLFLKTSEIKLQKSITYCFGKLNKKKKKKNSNKKIPIFYHVQHGSRHRTDWGSKGMIKCR